MNSGDEFCFEKSVTDFQLFKSGWQLNDFAHSNPLDCHVFYVRDYRTLSLNLFTVNKIDLTNVKTGIAPMGELSYEICAAVGGPNGECLDTKMSELLGISLASYIKQTAAYKVWLGSEESTGRLHALLNIYESPDGVAMLRPAILNREDAFISPAEILDLSFQIKEIDSGNHPEWFK